MRVLAIEPYFGGSHAAFLRGWSAHSAHTWTLHTLPAHKWKWRMRHAALTLSERANAELASGQAWDVLFCSDMLNLAEYRGLAPEAVRRLPTVAYFHENQLTYPVRNPDERDYHFAFTHLATCAAADAVWFNSAFHRDSFFEALTEWLRRMPDFQPLDRVEQIRARTEVQPLGIDWPVERGPRLPGPLRIVWAARWEHDKNPADFFAALEMLEAAGVPFEVSVIGQQFATVPEEFATARQRFAPQIRRWGYLPEITEYWAALSEADVFVSTATHEFFGISLVEALAAGCYPLVPRRLAYPEVLGAVQDAIAADYFYDGSVAHLGTRLRELSARVAGGRLWPSDEHAGRRSATKYTWTRRGPELDAALGRVVASRSAG